MKLVFTICSINYLAQAKSLGESILAFNPNYCFKIVLVDKIIPLLNLSEKIPFEIIEAEKLGIAEFTKMCSQYNVTELNTAVKPFAFDYFFNHHPEYSTAIYFDPDILVYEQLIELEESLVENDIILTPHITKPIEDLFSPQETDFLNSGLYNLGFIALKKTENSSNFLSWWINRLKDHCRIDFLNGLFVDQLWINFVPLFFKKVHILRNPGYNMAYWNLHERKLSFSNEKYVVNESYPLIFFHFSGYKIDKPYALSVYQNRFNFNSRPDLTELFIQYSKIISKNLHEEFSKIPCHYSSIEKNKLPSTLEKKSSRLIFKKKLSSLTNYFSYYLKNKF